MGDVIRIPTLTTADDNPIDVLEMAKKWGMVHCVVVGHGENGELMFGGSTSDLEKIVTLLERAKLWSMNEMDD